MGTELIGDHWLTLLIMPGAPTCKPASTLLRTQVLTHNRTGHYIAFGAEFPRKQILSAAAKGNLPKCYVRCWRCEAVAWLSDWVAGAALTKEQRADRITQAIATGQANRIEFLQPCSGSRYLDDLLTTINAYDKEDAT